VLVLAPGCSVLVSSGDQAVPVNDNSPLLSRSLSRPRTPSASQETSTVGVGVLVTTVSVAQAGRQAGAAPLDFAPLYSSKVLGAEHWLRMRAAS
jgi:hypothetical protein